jgi:DNA repair exonuclease SbcCD nuclease subunit
MKPEAEPAAADLVVVHSSDIHIDDDYTARLFRGDGTMGLRLILEAARDASADLVILAGDVFEHNRLPVSLIDQTAALLEEFGLPTVILPGNHDPVTSDSVYRRGSLGDVRGVHILGVNSGDQVILPALDLEVWGHAHRDYGDMAPLRDPPKRRQRRRIAVAHGHYVPVPEHVAAPHASWLFGDAAIAAADADYLALGHWNRSTQVSGGTPAYYSGSPELTRSVNLVRLGPNGTAVSRHPLRWPFPE